jgi:hypothetical protein
MSTIAALLEESMWERDMILGCEGIEIEGCFWVEVGGGWNFQNADGTGNGGEVAGISGREGFAVASEGEEPGEFAEGFDILGGHGAAL